MLTVCGSLQGRSANRAALEAASAVAVAGGALVDDFERLADVPAFDPGRAEERIEVVDGWRGRVRAADVVLVAAPEYAGGVAGAVKNALDWLVGSGELYRKPVAVISAGTSGGLHARRMLAQTLTWQGAYVVGQLGIASPRTTRRTPSCPRCVRRPAACSGRRPTCRVCAPWARGIPGPG